MEANSFSIHVYFLLCTRQCTGYWYQGENKHFNILGDQIGNRKFAVNEICRYSEKYEHMESSTSKLKM